jgi:hypothetical protein
MLAKHTYTDCIIQFSCLPVSYRTLVALSRIIMHYFRTKSLLVSHQAFSNFSMPSVCIQFNYHPVLFLCLVFVAFSLCTYDQTPIFFAQWSPRWFVAVLWLYLQSVYWFQIINPTRLSLTTSSVVCLRMSHNLQARMNVMNEEHSFMFWRLVTTTAFLRNLQLVMKISCRLSQCFFIIEGLILSPWIK